MLAICNRHFFPLKALNSQVPRGAFVLLIASRVILVLQQSSTTAAVPERVTSMSQAVAYQACKQQQQ